MSYPGRRKESPGIPDSVYRIGSIVVIAVVVFILWKTGALFTIRNWVAGVYSSGSTAVTDSQKNFGATLAGDRKRQEERGMGVRQ